MRRLAFQCSLVVAVLLQLTQIADACGDKFLIGGRGVKYGVAYAAIYPARILIYANTRTGSSATIRDAKFQAALKAAGHEITFVENESLVGPAVRSGTFDVIVADAAQGAMLQEQAQLATSRPSVLPVLNKPTRAEEQAAEKQFTCKVKASDNANKFLGAIDEMMQARLKSRKPKK